MSRFFKGDTSGSDSDSSVSSGSDYSDREIQSKSKGEFASRFAKGGYSSSDESEDEVKRVVKSAKDKQTDEALNSIKGIRNGLKINDWTVVQADFDKLSKVMPKLTKSGSDAAVEKRYLIKTVVKIEAGMEKFKDKAAIKKLNANNARALNTLKQRIKKVIKEKERQVQEYRENPILSEEEQDEEVKGREEDQVKETKRTAGGSKKKAVEEDEESSDSYWEQSESESDSDSDSDTGKKGINKWLKREPAEKKTVAAPKDKKEQKQKARVDKKKEEEESGEESEEDDGFKTVTRKAKKEAALSAENLGAKLKEVVESRGRRGTAKHEVVATLEKMYKVAETPLQRVEVLMVLIPAQIDMFGIGSETQITASWKAALELINRLLGVLETSPSVVVAEHTEGEVELEELEQRERDGLNVVYPGSLVGLLERVYDEFRRSLVAIDPHTTNYVERMADDFALYQTVVRMQRYLHNTDQQDEECRAIIRRIEYIHFRPDQITASVEAQIAQALGDKESATVDSEQLMTELCGRIYSQGSPMLRARAMLMHIYHHALHKRYYAARDMFLVSHMQDSIGQADIATQILYNRALAQLGLAAFRLGMFQEAFSHLLEIMNTGRVSELLGQSSLNQKHSGLSQEMEFIVKKNLLPFHMHINFELLESSFLTCSMLVDLSESDSKRQPTNRLLRRLLDYNSRMIFTGPPENSRDHIMAAAKSLAVGDWENAFRYIDAVKIWSLLPDAALVKGFLREKIKVEAFKTYLLTYRIYYDSMSIDTLSAMFDLPSRKLYSVLAMMIYSSDLPATLDEIARTIHFERTSADATSRLQSSMLYLSDKVTSLADANEKIFELKINGGRPLAEKSAFASQPIDSSSSAMAFANRYDSSHPQHANAGSAKAKSKQSSSHKSKNMPHNKSKQSSSRRSNPSGGPNQRSKGDSRQYNSSSANKYNRSSNN